MPPATSLNKSKAGAQRRSRSRNSTPGSTTVGPGFDQTALKETEFLGTPLSKLMVPTNVTYGTILESFEHNDIIDRHGNVVSVPDARTLEELAGNLKTLDQLAENRCEVCDRGMRDLARKRKDVAEDERIRRERERDDKDKEERREKYKRDLAIEEEEEKNKGSKKQKRAKDSSRSREERPLTHGAHALTRQDVDMKDASSSPDNKRLQKRPSTSPGKARRDGRSISVSTTLSSRPATPGSMASAPSPTDSIDSHQPVPAASVPQYQVFGPDPSTFDDPTIYHIREIEPGMTEEDIKEIYAVTSYPHDDLHDLIPGTPPDKDYSSGKPTTNQVAPTTFATAVEPFFRVFTEEDIAFLREKGERSHTFEVPRRAKRTYADTWAEEDGAMSIDSSSRREQLPPNQARGSMDRMDDDTAATEKVSVGPLYARVLAAFFVGDRTQSEDKPNGLTNGDVEMTGMGNDVNGSAENGNGERNGEALPATHLTESSQPGWKPSTTKIDGAQTEERLKQELEYIGFFTPGVVADFDAHYDDDVAERLRLLQDRLRTQTLANCARRARISALLKERIAHQEYTTIREDLDNQVTQAFQKRNRTMGKSKKQQKRPGGAGGGSHAVGPGGAAAGTSRPGIGDVAKTLMERRKRWIDNISPVFDDVPERVPREGETIFPAHVMAPLMQHEKDNWDDGED